MNRKPKLIFLSGYKASGKDSFANFLVEEYQKDKLHKVVRVAFADALKKEVYPKYGVEYDGNASEDYSFKESVRDELISTGESMKQKEGMYYWIMKALEPIIQQPILDKKLEDIPDIIVTDCRRVEEVMWFKHVKYGTLFPEIKAIFDMVFVMVHRKDTEEQENDYLTKLAIMYALETKVLDRLVRNYSDLNNLKNIAANIYATKLR